MWASCVCVCAHARVFHQSIFPSLRLSPPVSCSSQFVKTEQCFLHHHTYFQKEVPLLSQLERVVLKVLDSSESLFLCARQLSRFPLRTGSGGHHRHRDKLKLTRDVSTQFTLCLMHWREFIRNDRRFYLHMLSTTLSMLDSLNVITKFKKKLKHI